MEEGQSVYKGLNPAWLDPFCSLGRRHVKTPSVYIAKAV